MKPFEYIPNFVSEPSMVESILWAELDWERRDKTPRCEYYCNEINVPYTYGIEKYARTYYPKPFHPLITEIKKDLEAYTGTKFEVCFLNGYLNQSDHLGWHSDDSPEMDDNRPIAVISLGAEREIWLRQKNTPEDEVGVYKQRLGNGSLWIMGAGLQDTTQHRIPKSDRVCGKRISLTFRGYVNPK